MTEGRSKTVGRGLSIKAVYLGSSTVIYGSTIILTLGQVDASI